MTRMGFPTLILCMCALLSASSATCWEPGRHPGFKAPPRIWQLTIDRVRVSWKGLVTKAACVDNFVVKYWQRLDAREYKVTPLIDARKQFVDLDIIPYVIYHYQVSAREESGLGKVTYNRAPVVTFQTSRGGGASVHSRQYFARYHDGDFAQDYFELDYDAGEGAEARPGAPPPPPMGDSPFEIAGMAGEVFLIVCVVCTVMALVALGVVYKFCTVLVLPLVIGGNDDDDDSDDSDGDEDDDSLAGEMERKLAALDTDEDDEKTDGGAGGEEDKIEVKERSDVSAV